MKELKEFSVTVPWGHVALKAWGSPTNFPVLCVHGILDNAGAFDRLINLLPDNYYYVSIDLPGHGFSSHFPAGVPLEFFNYVLAIRYIVEALKWKKFNYIGHSLGAQLGTFYSIVYPGQIQKLVLIEGMITISVTKKDLIPRIKLLIDNTLENLKDKKPYLYTHDEIMHGLQFRRGTCLNADAAEAIFARSVTKEGDLFKYNRDARLKVYCFPLFNSDQLVHLIGKVRAKILLIFTDSTLDTISRRANSFLTRRGIEQFVDGMDNIDAIYVDGNHDVHNNHPERLNSEIIKFMDDNNIASKL